MASLLEYAINAYEFRVDASVLALGIGAFWFAISATKEIRHILHSIGDIAKVRKNRSTELKSLFIEFIDAHWIVKQLSRVASIFLGYHWTLCLSCFQSRTRFFRHPSTHIHVAFYLEPFGNFGCHVNLSKGNSSVFIKSSKIKHIHNFVELFRCSAF